MESLFETNIANGDILLNPEYQQQLDTLAAQIKHSLILSDTEKYICLNHWAYRLSGIVWHSLEFDNGKSNYTLTLSESSSVDFFDSSFSATERAICVYDSLDVNSLIHYLNQHLKKEGISLISSFSNNCS